VPREYVDDPADPRLIEFLGLRDHELRMRREAPGGAMAGVFVGEGDLVVTRAVRAGYTVRAVLVDAARTTPLPMAIDAAVPIYRAGPSVLQRVTGYHAHRGVLAAFDRRPVPDAAEILGGAQRIVVVEGIVNPTNLGVIVRSAAGLGMDALVLDPTSCDPLYRRASRVAMGEVYAFPYARVPAFPDGLDEVRRSGFRLLALTPDPDAVPIDEVRVEADDRVALVFGAESPGLTAATLAAVDGRVRIPMHGEVDSLNVGVAAAVACYALARAGRRAAR
jgi:tRNA G18 (ribose-2'-O)-methylase SpoU